MNHRQTRELPNEKEPFFKRHKVLTVVGAALVVGYSLYAIGYNANRSEPQKAATVAPSCQVDASKLLEHINSERTRLGAPALRIDASLATAARYKLDSMVTEKYFAHKMADGTAWSKHARDIGIKAALAENIGSNDNTPEQSWNEFKNSPNHYKSMIDTKYTRVGIATQCTDYIQEKAVEPGDEQYTGTKITDLTVVTLAADEPVQPAQVAPSVQQQRSSSQYCTTTPQYSYHLNGYTLEKTVTGYTTRCM